VEELNLKTYIYILKEPDTGCIRYVGKTVSPKNRMKSHKCLKGTKGTHLSSWIVSLRNKNQVPIMEIIDEIEGNEWKEKESFYIEFYKKHGCDLVNLTTGGEGCEGYKHCEKIKIKMSEIQKNMWSEGKRKYIPTMSGKKHTDISKIKMSFSQSGHKNPQYGKKISDSVKEKISKKLGKEIKIKNVIYQSLRKAAKSLNLNWATFKYRYKMGLRLT